MDKNSGYNLVKYAAIFGNVIFIIWIIFNGISEGFVATLLEKLSYIGLIILLGLNTFYLVGKVK